MNRHDWISGKKAKDPIKENKQKQIDDLNKTPFENDFERLIARAEELARIQRRERERNNEQ